MKQTIIHIIKICSKLSEMEVIFSIKPWADTFGMVIMIKTASVSSLIYTITFLVMEKYVN